jgi:hypothetical protein
VKIARQAHCHKADNWIDVAGYAACGAECDARYNLTDVFFQARPADLA